jgi:3'(2'), 5'-bisphosphate nucleotidase
MAPAELMEEIRALAAKAGEVVLRYYEGGTEVRKKADASPVTEADEAAEALIVAGLRELTPDVPIVAEELVAGGRVPEIGRAPFWLVDPLDGTKEFISGNGEFTVNIALIEGEQPALGVVLAPAIGRMWWGIVGGGAWCSEAGGKPSRIRARPRPATGVIAMASRSHADAETEAFLDEQGVVERISSGSSIKFCLLAEGRADLYPRFGPTMEWDTAAGHAVLLAAGGQVVTRDGAPFLYRKPGFRNPGFIASGN